MNVVFNPEERTRDRIFACIVRYKRAHDGLSPTNKHIADTCFIAPSTVRYHLYRLEGEGRIRLVKGGGIEVVGGHWECDEALGASCA